MALVSHADGEDGLSSSFGQSEFERDAIDRASPGRLAIEVEPLQRPPDWKEDCWRGEGGDYGGAPTVTSSDHMRIILRDVHLEDASYANIPVSRVSIGQVKDID